MKITYDRLKKIASDVRADLALKGKIDGSRGKIRKKPRTKEKADMLYRMAMERVDKNKPRIDKEGKIILPYFYKRP
jgi:hypothetical protein